MMQARGDNSKYTPLPTPKSRLLDALLESNWIPDRHGNYLKTVVRGTKTSKYRVKLKDLVCRIEVLVEHVAPNEKTPGSARMWVKVGGAYYKDVMFDPTGLVWIGSYKFGRAR